MHCSIRMSYISVHTENLELQYKARNSEKCEGLYFVQLSSANYIYIWNMSLYLCFRHYNYVVFFFFLCSLFPCILYFYCHMFHVTLVSIFPMFPQWLLSLRVLSFDLCVFRLIFVVLVLCAVYLVLLLFASLGLIWPSCVPTYSPASRCPAGVFKPCVFLCQLLCCVLIMLCFSCLCS